MTLLGIPITFTDVLISSAMIILVISLVIIMYFIPTIFGMKWAKAKGITPHIMWLMWFFYPGFLALIIMRYLWIKELINDYPFFKIYHADKEAIREIKNTILPLFILKRILLASLFIMVFSLFFVTTGLYNTKLEV
ncbi:MAG: hypothetical protein Q9M36_08705, partial [Sulfurovum sp.]|nr:hypothetical protein [Sulfurovum sp.]